MKRCLLILLLAILSFSGMNPGCLSAKTQSSPYKIARTVGSIGLRINKIEYRKDLTRVYGEIVGRPHTAARIDSMFYILPSGKSIAWTDIDGFDAKRYFQWEDDGLISIEIDFPPIKPTSTFQIKASGSNGEHLWTIIKEEKDKLK